MLQSQIKEAYNFVPGYCNHKLYFHSWSIIKLIILTKKKTTAFTQTKASTRLIYW